MAKGDLNNDGQEDLIIGSTNLMGTTVYLRKENKFIETHYEGLSGPKNDFQKLISNNRYRQ